MNERVSLGLRKALWRQHQCGGLVTRVRGRQT